MSRNTQSAPTAEMECGMCGAHFQRYEGMRESGTCGGAYMCKPDQDEFDSIDWGAIREREAGMA